MKLHELLDQLSKCQYDDTVVIDVDADQCISDRNVLDILEARRENMGDETTGDEFWIFIQAGGEGVSDPTTEISEQRQTFVYLGRDQQAKPVSLAINAVDVDAVALKNRFKKAQHQIKAPNAAVFLRLLLDLFDKFDVPKKVIPAPTQP